MQRNTFVSMHYNILRAVHSYEEFSYTVLYSDDRQLHGSWWIVGRVLDLWLITVFIRLGNFQATKQSTNLSWIVNAVIH